jgi:hypothetical protein
MPERALGRKGELKGGRGRWWKGNGGRGEAGVWEERPSPNAIDAWKSSGQKRGGRKVEEAGDGRGRGLGGKALA